MKKIVIILFAYCIIQGELFTQVTADTLLNDAKVPINTTYFNDYLKTPPPTITIQQKKWRMPLVFGTTAALYAGSFIGLNELWYASYPKSNFHFINDNAEWFGMDKMGHAATAYYIGYYTQPVFKWSGMSYKASVWTGGLLGFSYQTTIEVLDGLSAEWGASWGDMIANASGSALYVSQELLWKEQRVMVKYSYSPSIYANMRPNLLGSNFAESLLKDYNAQTYWLSCNIWSFLPNRNTNAFPRWFNIAVGYGANGMLGGFENPIEFANIPRYQQFYLTIDIDFTKIETKSKFLKTFFKIIQLVKIPMPAMEFTTKPGQPVILHWLMF